MTDMYKIIDLSRGIFSSELYPGTDAPRLERSSDMADGDPFNCSSLTIDLHTATHVDSPNHFLKDGTTIELVPLERYFGRCRVWNCAIRDMNSLPEAADVPILLLKNAPYLGLDDCRTILDKGYTTLGTDRLSPSAPNDEEAVHRLLLGSGAGLVESLELSRVSEGIFMFVALPLKIEGAEASPVRAVIIDCNSEQ